MDRRQRQGEVQMPDVKWYIKGDYILGCNCDYGCPCNFNARPSPGFCQGAILFRVEDGAYGAVRLDGLSGGWAVKWPGAIHEGNGLASFYIDERANPEQRDALTRMITGEAGGAPFSILAGTYSHTSGPHFVKIEIAGSGENTAAKVDGRVSMSFQPIRNPVTKEPAYPRVVLPQGFIFKEGDQYTLREFWVSDGPELNFAHPGKCAEFAKVHWQGP
jgi:hypothetical protein